MALASSFAQKVFVITGGGSGIGLQTALKLLAANATVHVIELGNTRPSSLDNKSVHWHTADITSREAVIDVFSVIERLTPQIHGLVNSAGICPGGDGFYPTDENYHRTMAVNVTGTWNCATAFLGLHDKHLRTIDATNINQAPIASIVNLGSSASLCPWPTLAAYTASKHAVLGLTRSWAMDWAAKGIRVNLVAPGGTDTPLARAQMNDPSERGPALSATTALITMGRLGQPEEQADAILYLLSQQSSYITGQAIAVNGGYPMH
ncbi:NAD(P)-binding protein [Pyrenochaeta sp. DS3sAY3a]|nr:NAD(P)-binding protein [Pyrenochaeta sp. DS3sAY3a]